MVLHRVSFPHHLTHNHNLSSLHLELHLAQIFDQTTNQHIILKCHIFQLDIRPARFLGIGNPLCPNMCTTTYVQYLCGCRGRRLGMAPCEYATENQVFLANGVPHTQRMFLLNESLCDLYSLTNWHRIDRRCSHCLRAQRLQRRQQRQS